MLPARPRCKFPASAIKYPPRCKQTHTFSLHITFSHDFLFLAQIEFMVAAECKILVGLTDIVGRGSKLVHLQRQGGGDEKRCNVSRKMYFILILVIFWRFRVAWEQAACLVTHCGHWAYLPECG